MANNEKYRSNGSAAYDIHTNQAAVRNGSPARPLPSPERLPQAPVRRKPTKKVKAKISVSPLAVVGTIVSVLMLLMVLFSYVRLYEVKSFNGELRSELTQLNTQQERLRSQYEDRLDLAQIEARAIELGMRQPSASQIVYVQVSSGDMAEVFTAPEERNVFERVYDAFKGAFTDALEYFS